MKIGFITERMLRGFGVDLAIDQVARGLAAGGQDVTVYASNSDDTFAPGGYRLKLIPTPASSFFPRHELVAQRHLAFLNAEDIDIWLVHTFPFFSLLPRLSAPAIAVEYGVSSSEGFPVKIRSNFAYVKFMQQHVYLRWAKKIITISEFLKADMLAGLRRKTTVIYLGADHYQNLPPGDSVALREKLGVSSGEILMLYVGRLSAADQPYKGTTELVDLYRRLRSEIPDLRLLMTGFGGPRERQWLESQGVLVLENAPADIMPAIFSACDMYVTASKWEGFDLPLVEAQSFGKSVAALAVGAHPEVVADGKTGLLAGDVMQLVQSVRKLAADPDLRERLGRAAVLQVEKFRWEKTVAQYQLVIDDVLSR